MTIWGVTFGDHQHRILNQVAVRLLSTNVLPAYQRWGVGVVLLSGIVPDVLKWGIQEAEFSWVLESNTLSRSSLQRGGAKLYKTYRIYQRESLA